MDSSRFAATRPDMEVIAESLWTPVVSRESTMPLVRGDRSDWAKYSYEHERAHECGARPAVLVVYRPASAFEYWNPV